MPNIKAPKEDVLQFVGLALQIEQRNKAMNSFVADRVDKMRKTYIYAHQRTRNSAVLRETSLESFWRCGFFPSVIVITLRQRIT